MRLSLVVAASLAASLRAAPAQSAGGAAPDALKDTLVALETQSWEAWQKRDSAFFQRFLSDDHVEVGFGGVTGKATVVAGVGSPACVVSSYTVDGFALSRFDANTALLTYHAVQRTTCGGTAVPSPVWVSSLYVRRDGRWLNAVYQQTPDNRRKAP
ncbi:MAG TPA: nuclear transport factor 2 family protein [Gemmatimonadaceae bacterium]|nr:nuclear transport factor 2 family protein [Gemmatimonadaceae bacterium]